MIRTVKDALREELDIPTAVIDMDVNDPTFAPDAEIKDKLEGFLDVLEDRR